MLSSSNAIRETRTPSSRSTISSKSIRRAACAVPLSASPVRPLLPAHSIDIHDQGYTGTTLIFTLSSLLSRPFTRSIDRLDRFPYILERWKGPVSVGLFVPEAQLYILAKRLFALAPRRNVVFTIYVLKTIVRGHVPFYNDRDDKRIYAGRGMYPVNLLRDLAIESISTTHYMIIDADVLLSTTLYSHIDDYKTILRNHKNTVVLPLFEYCRVVGMRNCMENGVCKDLLNWLVVFIVAGGTFPRTATSSCGSGTRGTSSPSSRTFTWECGHEFIVASGQLHGVAEPDGQSHARHGVPPDGAVGVRARVQSRYAVVRRSAIDPIFHPSFFDYGGNKQEFWSRMLLMKCNLCASG